MIPLVAAITVLLAAAFAYLMVTRLADRGESGVPLGLFRIAYGCVLFCEVAQMLYDAPLITDPVAFLQPGEIQLTYLLLAWLVALLFLIAGFHTRSAAVVSYLCGLCTFSIFHEFEYHVDYVFTGVNALLIIAPAGRCLSVDRLLSRRDATNRGLPEPSDQVSALYRKLFVLVSLALVYFDSVLWKLSSPMWTGGLGVWLPASLPQVSWYDFSFLLDREWLVKGLGYLTLVVESLFLFLMWFEAAAIPLAIVGAGLHLGITAVFPIPWFGLAEAAAYILVLPATAYRWIGARRQASHVHSDGTQDERTLAPWAPPSRARRIVLGALATAIIALQVAASVQSPTIRRLVGPPLNAKLAKAGHRITKAVSQPVLGIQTHPVFMESIHFRGYNHIAAIVYDDPDGGEVWLPVIRPSGQPHWMNSGRLWVYWTFRVMSPRVNRARLERGIKRVTAFWMHRNGISPRAANFRILVKPIEVPRHWERGFLRRQMEQPWKEAGTATWTNGVFHAAIRNIEAIR